MRPLPLSVKGCSAASLSRVAETQDLLLELARRGGQSCPTCGYSLDGLRSRSCPECGELLELTLRAKHSHRVAWTVGLFAWAAAFGLYGLLVPLLVILNAAPPRTYWSFYLGTVITWPVIGVWLLSARWYRRQSRTTRVALATISCILVAALFLLTGFQLQ